MFSSAKHLIFGLTVVLQLLSEILVLLLLYAVLTKVLSFFVVVVVCLFVCFAKYKGRWCFYLHMLTDGNQENGAILLSEIHSAGMKGIAHKL